MDGKGVRAVIIVVPLLFRCSTDVVVAFCSVVALL